MPLQEEYQVSVEAFCGPMDLLLYLIRRAEVDVQNIPIAAITDQYLAFLSQLTDVDVEIAGEFLVMAATLIEIKSRALVPPEDRTDEGADAATSPAASIDPGRELIRQLLAYQRFRIAGEALDDRRLRFGQRFVRRPARQSQQPIEALPELELDDVHALDLSDAYQRIMAAIDFGRLGDHRVEMDDTPLALYQADLLDRLDRSRANRLSLTDAFSGHNRVQRIGLFLATLELVRLRRITVAQSDLEGPIELQLNVDPGEALQIDVDDFSALRSPDATQDAAP